MTAPCIPRYVLLDGRPGNLRLCFLWLIFFSFTIWTHFRPNIDDLVRMKGGLTRRSIQAPKPALTQISTTLKLHHENFCQTSHRVFPASFFWHLRRFQGQLRRFQGLQNARPTMFHRPYNTMGRQTVQSLTWYTYPALIRATVHYKLAQSSLCNLDEM